MDTLITIHSLLRWIVLLDGLVTIGACVALWLRVIRLDAGIVQQVSRGFTIMLDIEVALGLLLWLLHLVNGPPLGTFTLIGHPLLMLVAVGVAHMTLVRSNRVADEQARGQGLALGFLASLVIVALAIPGWIFR